MITKIERLELSGTNAERTAMAVTPGTFITFYETDTNDEYEYKGSEWIQTRINGAVPVTTQGGMDARGNYPNTWYLQSSATVAASATDNVLIYTSGDVSMYNYHVIENYALTDPVDIYVSLDGTNFSTAAAAVTLLDDVTTGGGIAVIDIPKDKIGVLKGKFMAIKVLRKGTTNEAQNIRYAHSVN